MSFLSKRRLTSLSERQCPECHDLIPQGRRYVKFACSCDGDFYSGFTCVGCDLFKVAYLDLLRAQHHDDPDIAHYTPGAMLSEAAETLDCWTSPAWKNMTWVQRRIWMTALVANATTAARAHDRRRRDTIRGRAMIVALAAHGHGGGAPLLKAAATASVGLKPEYVAFVAELVAERRSLGGLVDEPQWDDAAVTRAQCQPWTARFVARFPHLRRERGFYVLRAHGDDCPTEHWWCVDVDGTIVDPTVSQFPAGGRYSPYAAREFPARVGGCPECGGDVFEDSDADGFCDTECRDTYAQAMA